ncbi:hypothetical protein NKH77_12340 [Streptomyces sp. M19]
MGHNDRQISRLHGELTYRGQQWWLRNTGQRLLRLPRGRLMHTSTDAVPSRRATRPCS